jgi:choline dehydrogenase-like flavoprotein
MLVAQGYLHSDHSPSIGIRLEPEPEEDRLELTPIANAESRPMIRRVLGKLTRQARRLGAVPLSPLLQVGTPGRGFHSGGSVPMRRAPGPFECDTLGRPNGWQRVHVVDASVFPSVPATTITFTAMANAHRIATAAAHL